MSGTIDFQTGAAPEPIQDADSADVHQGSPVGGVFYSADKMNLISPWIAAISIIGCIAIISFVAKTRKVDSSFPSFKNIDSLSIY